MQNLNECYIITRRSREQHLGVAQLGSALEWGSRGRKFKSSHPDQSVADLTRPRRFLQKILSKASLTRSVAPLYSAARKCEPFIRSSFLRSTRNYRSFTHFRSRRKPVEFQVTNVRCSLLCRGQEEDAFITSDKARRMSSLIFLMKIFASKNLKLRALRSILADRHG